MYPRAEQVNSGGDVPQIPLLLRRVWILNRHQEGKGWDAQHTLHPACLGHTTVYDFLLPLNAQSVRGRTERPDQRLVRNHSTVQQGNYWTAARRYDRLDSLITGCRVCDVHCNKHLWLHIARNPDHTSLFRLLADRPGKCYIALIPGYGMGRVQADEASDSVVKSRAAYPPVLVEGEGVSEEDSVAYTNPVELS